MCRIMNKTGFGFLRLPLLDEKDETSFDFGLLFDMVDEYIRLGGKYFDTAYTYLGQKSEEALRKAVVERHPRSSFVIADKLPGWKINSYDECDIYFNTQLQRCGVSYFDVYLLHWLNKENYDIAKRTNQFEFLKKVKSEGKALKTGFSYHDSPELLDQIIIENPDLDYVQLQINYLDWDSEILRAKDCYEVCVKYNKRVIVMEPVKGGTLAKLPDEAEKYLDKISPNLSLAAKAISFATNLDMVDVVLSGMNSLEQIRDNMQNFELMTQSEYDALKKAADIIRQNTKIPCSGCNYCSPNCPNEIPIPKYFSLYNEYFRKPEEDWKMQIVYDSYAGGKASDCVECGLCEDNCPQKIQIRKYLAEVASVFEND